MADGGRWSRRRVTKAVALWGAAGWMGLIVLAAVFVILLPMLFRSIRLGLLGILINGLPLAMTFGLMGLLGSRLNMATALIGGVAIGSTVDSTLFFINRFQAELALGRTHADAIEAAVRGVGDGIVITTGILAGGFLCMTVSSFKPTAARLVGP